VHGYADQVGLSHIKPHDFRRFVGTPRAKRDIRRAQKALGHTRIDTTARGRVRTTAHARAPGAAGAPRDP
jgi:integrase